LSSIPRFVAYAAEFEKAFESDDWSLLEPFFTEDAVYEVGLPILGSARCEDRAAILAWFPDVLDRFDRRFASRTLELLDGPKEEDGEVWIRGSATYRSPGVPDFVLVLEETVRFEGDRIDHLEDCYTTEMVSETERFVREYGSKLGLELNSD
jgi:hypothetical protein